MTHAGIDTLEHAEKRLHQCRVLRENTPIDTPEYRKYCLLCTFFARRIEHLKGVYHPVFSW